MTTSSQRLSSRFSDAMTYAAELHNLQTRKGTTTPYVSHLMGVSSLVLEHGGNEDEAIAGLLHDSIEDQAEHNGGADAMRADISQRFGNKVLAIVEGCTDADTDPKPPWRGRKEAYIAHLATASPSILLVSCSDKLHNARAILLDFREHGDELWERFSTGRNEILWYYSSLVAAFQAANAPGALVRELDRTVGEFSRLAKA